MPHDSSKGGSFKKIKYTPCYTPLDPLNQPVPKFPFIEKERQTEYFNSKDKRSFASSFSITKNKRFSLLDPKETKDHDSSTNYYNIFNTKIRTRNTQKDNARTFFASTDKNVYNLKQLNRGLIPHIKPRVHLFARKVNSTGHQATPEKLRLSPAKLTDTFLLRVGKKSSSGQSSLEAKRSKPKWYDCRPRLIINRYYRENFVLNATKNIRKITLADIWQSAAGDRSLFIPVNLFNKSGFSSEKFAKLAKSLQKSKTRVKRDTKNTSKLNKSYNTNQAHNLFH
eukprot:TRINITY_DN14590_c0_g1_i1.p1 TRINITY_DN14590_c0_g1~~TRINITY_DN14590_c0_g1_i1.p1  ORF type:complete len:296 (+),score=36.75 TRINITY_DN14590_c0_g1_i1:45-890(+)